MVILILYLFCMITINNYPAAYLGFHFGGVQNFSGKVGVFAWREAPRVC